MPIDSRGQYDILLDRIVSALTAYSAAQALIDPLVAFKVVPGSFRTIQSTRVPTIGVHLSSLRSARETASKGSWEANATYNLDLIANGKADGGTRGDSAAHARLLYLAQQALNAIYNSDSRTTIEAGGITIEWPSWSLAESDSYQEEAPLIGGRLTFEARLVYTPATAVGEPIDSISIDTGLWSALYEYGGSA